MSKIQITNDLFEKAPKFDETIEVRAWDLGGTPHQAFYIGGGVNFQASGNVWLELIYTIEGAQILYTRTFLHHSDEFDPAGMHKYLDKILQAREGSFGFGDMLPETSLILKLEKHTYTNIEKEEEVYYTSQMVFSADTGAIFGFTGPGDRFIEIKFNVDPDAGARFMHELIDELDAVFQGQHPNPAELPAGSSDWPFVWQLNRRAYNRLSESYQEAYFEDPLLAEAFNRWLAMLPAGGHVLDAGCGHGDPVVGSLLERGFQVTGADFTPEMLARARQKFPQAEFVLQAATQLAFESAFDGACSFSSLLYLDPIDLYHAIYRLYCALKPGAVLFLYGFDIAPGWRGHPFHQVMGEWMWSWHYGMEEVADRLEEHGFFDVIDTLEFPVSAESQQRYQDELEKDRLEREGYERNTAESASDAGFVIPYLSSMPEPPGYAYLLIARRSLYARPIPRRGRRTETANRRLPGALKGNRSLRRRWGPTV